MSKAPVTIPATAMPTNLLFAEHAVMRFYHVAKHGVTIDMITQPNYWTHVASKLRPGAHIEVLTEDNSFWADLLVLGAGRLEANVAILNYVVLEDVEVTDEDDQGDGLKIKWRGPVARWGIVRDDGEVLRDGFENKKAAEKWRANRNQNMAA